MSAYGTVTRLAPAGRHPPEPSHQTKSFMKKPADQGADTPVPVPVPVPDLSGDGDGASVPICPGAGTLPGGPPSPSPIC